MRAISKFAMCLFILIICTRLCAEQPGPSAVSGWRGDGNGKYLSANPPLDWGRQAKSVKELSAQAHKPKDGELPAKENAIPDGVIRQWLVLGPLPVPEGAKAEDILPEAPSMEPAENDKAGNQTWRAVKLDTNCADLCSIFNVPPEKKGIAAYAVSHLYSPSGQPIVLNALSQGQGCMRIWLNGAQVYFTGKDVDLDFSGARVALPLKQGWNKLLVLNARTRNDRKTWWFTCSLYGDKTAEYETRGIVWMTPLPALASSGPVIMDDRLYFTAESGSLVCANKADGKLLWVRSLSYYDFATAEERKANPEIFAELAPLAERVKQLDQSDLITPWKAPALEKDLRAVVERQIEKDMRKVSKDSYNNSGSWGCEAGYTGHTPVTDGQNVYALFGSGIVACYDRDGNVKWKRLLKRRTAEHSYTTSPLLVNGKVIIYLDDFTELDAKTGEVVLERPRFIPQGKGFPQTQFFGTGCVLQTGGEKVAYYPNSEIVRLSDGKTLTYDLKDLQIPNKIITPVSDQGLVYTLLRSPEQTSEGAQYAVSFKIPAAQGDRANPAIAGKTPLNIDSIPYYYNANICASPLFHEGLLYCVTVLGTLIVLDMEKGQPVYQKPLDIEIFMPYNPYENNLLKGGATASPTLAGKYIYIWGNQGTCVVLEPGRVFKQAAKNRIENFRRDQPLWREATMTNPVFEGERMYYRAESTLYCIGKK